MGNEKVDDHRSAPSPGKPGDKDDAHSGGAVFQLHRRHAGDHSQPDGGDTQAEEGRPSQKGEQRRRQLHG